MATLYPQELIEKLSDEQQVRLAEITLLMERLEILVEEEDLGGFFAFKLAQLARNASGYDTADKYWMAKAMREMTQHENLFNEYEAIKQVMAAQQQARLNRLSYPIGSTAGQQSITGTINTANTASGLSIVDAMKNGLIG